MLDSLALDRAYWKGIEPHLIRCTRPPYGYTTPTIRLHCSHTASTSFFTVSFTKVPCILDLWKHTIEYTQKCTILGGSRSIKSGTGIFRVRRHGDVTSIQPVNDTVSFLGTYLCGRGEDTAGVQLAITMATISFVSNGSWAYRDTGLRKSTTGSDVCSLVAIPTYTDIFHSL